MKTMRVVERVILAAICVGVVGVFAWGAVEAFDMMPTSHVGYVAAIGLGLAVVLILAGLLLKEIIRKEKK